MIKTSIQIMFKLKAFLVTILLFILFSTSMGFPDTNIKYKYIILSKDDLYKYVYHPTFNELDIKLTQTAKSCKKMPDAWVSGYKCCDEDEEAYFKCYIRENDYAQGTWKWRCYQFACIDNIMYDIS